jgi:hypothetical protein
MSTLKSQRALVAWCVIRKSADTSATCMRPHRKRGSQHVERVAGCAVSNTTDINSLMAQLDSSSCDIQGRRAAWRIEGRHVHVALPQARRTRPGRFTQFQALLAIVCSCLGW